MNSEPANSEPVNSDDGLQLREVTVKYGEFAALDSVNLEVPAREVIALLGPSGCGKSTLLRCIAGLEPLTDGTVCWKGNDLANVPVHRRGIGLMFQDHALFPHHDVAGNVEFGLRMAGMPADVRTRRVGELLELVGLTGLGDRTIGTLSGGQAQRVALARALAPEPELLLLDEPFGSLDRDLRDRLLSEIRTIVLRLGITAIHVTHDHDEAMSMADSLALMRTGTINRVGSVQELLATPGDRSTAMALGIETVWRLPVETGAIQTPFGPIATKPGVSEVDLLLRPGAVRITDEGTPGIVAANHHRGGDWLVTCRLAGERSVVAHSPERLPEGTSVNLTADLTAAEVLSSR